jgi:hypothetical protein
MVSVKLLSLLSILYHAVAFVPPCRVLSRRSFSVASQRFASQRESALDLDLKVAAAGLSMGAFFQVGAALAAEELEIVELPPPYVPLLFGVGILVGVGVLTSSLGDVYTEGTFCEFRKHLLDSIVGIVLITHSFCFATESSLGMQSGARAKKERDRSRSSYFKK